MQIKLICIELIYLCMLRCAAVATAAAAVGEDFDIDYLTKLFVGNHSVDNLAEIEQIYSDQCEPHNYVSLKTVRK